MSRQLFKTTKCVSNANVHGSVYEGIKEFYVFHAQLRNLQFSAKIFLTFLTLFAIFDLRALADGPIESLPLISWLVGWLVSQHDILKSAVTIS